MLQSGYYEYPLEYNNVGCFVNEVRKIVNKMAFYFKNTKRDIIMIEKDEKQYRKNTICDFVGKILNLMKLQIIVIQQANTEDQLIAKVIIMLQKK